MINHVFLRLRALNVLAYFTIQDVDLVLHIGDQIYPDDEDIAHAGKFFLQIYDGLVNTLKCDIDWERNSIFWEKLTSL